jgi:hypothetical protein
MSKSINENNAVVTDMELENNEHPIGKVCHFSTVTHAFRGKLVAVTASYMILPPGSEFVPLTGDIGVYSKSSKAKASEAFEVCHTEIRIPRGSIAWMLVFND